MNKTITLITLLILMVYGRTYAQDQRIFSNFFMNPYVINSAYVGSTGYTSAFLAHRQQWVGIEGAPMSTYISINTPLKNNLSVGGMIFNDNVGSINTSTGKATAGYLLRLDRKQFLRFGLSIGGGYTGYDVEAGNDPALLGLSGTSFILADLGFSYYYKRLNIGLSVPNLIGREVISQDGFANIQLKSYENLTLNANYRFSLNKEFSIEPHLIYRFSTVNMPQLEFAAVAHIGHVVWAGINYRQDFSAAALVGFKIQETWAVGFSYEYGDAELAGFSSGSLEISLGYNIGKKKKHQKQAVSFIQNFKKTKAQLDRAAERRQQLAVQRSQPPKSEPGNVETTESENQTTEQEALETPEDNLNIVSETMDHSVPLQERTTSEGVWELGATYIQTKEDSSKVSMVKWHDALTATPETDADLPPNTVRKGTHFLELPAGHHVVAGEFNDFQSAEDYSDKIFEAGYKGAIVGYVSKLKQYLVVVHKGATMQIALDEQERWSKRQNLNHVYILNVLN